MSRLTGKEVCDEFVWLVSNGLSIPFACESLGRNVSAMARLLWRYGYSDWTPALEQERRLEKSLQKERG